MASLTRRQFLLAGAAGVALAACGKGDDEPAAQVSTSSTPKGKAFNVVVASYIHVAGIDQRFTVALLNAEGTGPVALDGPLQLTVDGQSVESQVHTDGIPLPYVLARHTFPAPGYPTVGVTYKGATGEAALQVVDGAGLKVPYPGKPMIATPSPTAAATLGVDPVCTREPACPLHDVSLDAALAEKRPLAVLFSTPARCQSRLCGPVLDNLLAQRDAYADRVRFLHVEIYKARTGEELAPTVNAYGLEQEPILFLAGADGVVRDRLDNAFDRTEVKGALERLLA